MITTEVEIPFLEKQIDIFSDKSKYVCIQKGRRFGFTRGAAHACIEWMLEGITPILWGDTINANIKKYYDRYFYPILKKLNKSDFRFNNQTRELRILDSVMDFRSADRPENWEGFGYKKIILNEAGIILNDPYLFNNAVSPMMLDFPDSQLFAGGVPKGEYGKDGTKHLFYELCEKAAKKEKGYSLHQVSTFDNPLILETDILQLIEDLGGELSPVVRQEIYAEFINVSGTVFMWGFDPKRHVEEVEVKKHLPIYVSFDFNFDQMAVIIGQQDGNTYSFIDEITLNKADTKMVCEQVLARYPNFRYIVTGDASGEKHDTRDSRINDYQIIRSKLNGEFNVRKKNISLENSYTLCNTVFSHKTINLKVSPKCKILIHELQKAKFKERSGYELQKDRLNNKLDHFDAGRYLIDAMFPKFHKILGDRLY